MSTVRPAELAARLAATQHGLVTAAQCRELAVTRSTIYRRIRSGAWVQGDGWRYRLDLAYPRELLAIELDGKEGHLNDVAFEADPIRDNRLLLAGWTVLHYTWHRFIDAPAEVVEEVRAALVAGPS